ncbi:MAG: hypothetical protein H8E09_00900 [Gammaproteobacteria bacterium]|nr:hypothetical protein [Gammaproteobacteria bacterium]
MCNLDQIQNRIVPASHNFGTVVHHYLEYRQDHKPNNIKGFRHWLIDNTKIKQESTAKAYTSAFGPKQCNIINLSLTRLDQIVNYPDGFETAKFLSRLIPENINDAPKNIKCAFVIGMCNRTRQLTQAEFIAEVINRGWTPSEDAAKAIQTVGNSVLEHFNLVDEEFRPNGRFALLFGC